MAGENDKNAEVMAMAALKIGIPAPLLFKGSTAGICMAGLRASNISPPHHHENIFGSS
jgi:uncharacterized membrane protein AbrB (regulator of aidB expression)